MQNVTSIFNEVYEATKNKDKVVFDALNREAIIDIILDGDIFWLELQNINDCTDKEYSATVKFIEDNFDYDYLYNKVKEFIK